MRRFFRWIWKCFYSCAGCDNCTPFTQTTNSCLGKMKIEEEGIIVKVAGEVTAIKQRLLDMGFVRGAKVSVLRVAPLGDPIEVRIKGSCVALRKNEAYSILVELTSVQELVQLGCHH